MSNLPSPVVETTLGRVRGLMSGPVAAFLGLRYGQARRFQAPVAPAPVAGIIEATAHGPCAPQNVGAGLRDEFVSWYSVIDRMSEDCQVLNLHTPGCDGGRRPVMVWLHGGGWMNFSGNAPGTEGAALAAAQDVVVVTLNHRLGALGFLALEGADERLADSGNAGLLDIVLALTWVRDNIAAFGGDPGNVTIFGQSGGTAKVAALMEMAAAEGLFHKAILQSLSGGIRIAPQDEALQITDAMFTAAGVARGDIGALERLPLDRLLAAQDKLPRIFRPVIDGRGFDRHPFAPDAPPRSRGIPLMAGCTATESSFYLRDSPQGFSIDRASLARRLGRFLGTDPDATARIVQAYSDTMPGSAPADILLAVTTDQIFKRNTYHAAQLHGLRGSPAYAFLYARKTPVMDGLLQAPHCSDVPLVFGNPEAAVAFVGTGPDIAPTVSLMMATWGGFARTGIPAGGELAGWRPYSDPDRPVMSLGPEANLLLAPGEIARSALDHIPRMEYSLDRTTFVRD